ncbi:MAG: hypothetical protein AAFY76_00995 [Cyanobacteria bacterium J06649_11]
MTTSTEELMKQQWEAEEQEQLFLTGRISQKVYPKVWPTVFEDGLRPLIDLSKYGDGIKKFYFTFIVLENEVLEFTGSHYDHEERVLEVAIRIPLEELLEASQEEIIRRMEQTYLEAIAQIGEIELATPFDHTAFKADVEVAFTESNWYVEYLPENLSAMVNGDDLLTEDESEKS